MRGMRVLIVAITGLGVLPAAGAHAAGGGPATAPGITSLVSRPGGFGDLTAPIASDSGLDFSIDDVNFGAGSRIASDPGGRFVAFVSQADGLSPDDDNRVENVFVRDRTANVTTLVSRADGAEGAGADGSSAAPVISADGRYVAFTSSARNLVPGLDTGGTDQVYVRDLVARTTRLVSRAEGPAGTIADNDASAPAMSADGSTIAFVSRATNLAGGVPANVAQVYVRRDGAHTDLVSRRANGLSSPNVPGDDSSSEPFVSADGNKIAFSSTAVNLVGFGANDDGRRNVFVRGHDAGGDFDDGTTIMGDRPLGPSAPDGESGSPQLSADGSRIAFVSSAIDITAADTEADDDIYVREIPVTGSSATFLASRDSAGNNVSGTTSHPTLSDDGKRVAFTSFVPLTALDTNGLPDVYRRTFDVAGENGTLLASRALDGSALPGGASVGSIVPNGASVIFSTRSRGVGVDGPDEDFSQVYVRLLGTLLIGTPATQWISRPDGTGGLRTGVNASFGSIGRGVYTAPQSVSADGRFVVFTSVSDELFDGDDDRLSQVYVRDTLLGTTTLVSRADGQDGAPGNNQSGTGAATGIALGATYVPSAITPDGRYVAFASYASNLVPGDVNNRSDIFVRDLLTQTTALASRNADGTPLTLGSTSSAMSADGMRVAFATAAQIDPVADTMAGTVDVYVRDIAAGTTVLASRQTGAAGAAGNDHSVTPAISGDGNRVAFATDSTNLAPSLIDGNGVSDVYVRDLSAQTTALASSRSGTLKAGNDASTAPSISADGTKVAFASIASDLTPSDANGAGSDVFVRDLAAATTRLQSVSPAGTSGASDSYGPVLSADGNRILFLTRAGNLSPEAPLGGALLRDVAANTTTLAARADGAAGAAIPSVAGLGLSPDGHCAVFSTTADGLEPGLPAGTDFSRVHLRSLDAPCPVAPSTPGGSGARSPAGGTPQGSSPDITRPVISKLGLKPTRFRVGAKATALSAARRRAPVGTTIRFTLSEAAKVTLLVEQPKAGRRSGARCVKPTRKLRRRKACTRYVALGALRRNGKSGANTVAFSGRIGRRALRPGSYRLRVQAVDAAANRAGERVAGFRVVRR